MPAAARPIIHPRKRQETLFLTIAHNSANPVEYFGLPISQTISMGAEILL